MNGYQYGSQTPVPVQSRAVIQDAPRCWGKSYDETDRECRGCGFQSSCREEIFRRNAEPRPIATTYYGTPTPPRSYAYPQPAPYQNPPVPVQSQLTRSVPVTQPIPQPIQPQTAAMTHRYGWLQDPLYQALHAAPPPMRPQLPGESFLGRVAKNTFLAILEKACAEAFLAIRQMILAPESKTVEFTPLQPPKQ